MLQTVNHAFWNDWSYPQKVTFDGDNKIIHVNHGETVLDVKVDVYSAWKEWVVDPDHFNSKYLPAMRTTGGDPTVGGQFLGATFFLTNGWRLKAWEGDHRLSVIGNLYTDEGEPTFIPTAGYSIVIESQVSNLTTVGGTYVGSADIAADVWASPDVVDVPTVIEIADGVWTGAPAIPTAEQVAFAVWEEAMLGHATPDSFGKRLKELLPTLWGL